MSGGGQFCRVGDKAVDFNLGQFQDADFVGDGSKSDTVGHWFENRRITFVNVVAHCT